MFVIPNPKRTCAAHPGLGDIIFGSRTSEGLDLGLSRVNLTSTGFPVFRQTSDKLRRHLSDLQQAL